MIERSAEKHVIEAKNISHRKEARGGGDSLFRVVHHTLTEVKQVGIRTIIHNSSHLKMCGASRTMPYDPIAVTMKKV